jgi:hypothetical protein
MALDDYDQIVLDAAQRHKVDPRLLKAMLSVESGGDPGAVGPPVKLKNGQVVNARGVMQFLPDTAAEYKVDPADPKSSIIGGANYLSDLLNQYGTPEAALNHYSGGGGESYTRKVLDAYKTVNLPGMSAAALGAVPATPPWDPSTIPATPGNFQQREPGLFGNPGVPGRPTPGWQQQNLVPVPVYGSNQPVMVNRLVANSVAGFLGNLADIGYPLGDVQGYNLRANRNDPRSVSAHGYGTAFDVNPLANPNASTQTNLPPQTRDLANAWGLKWGMDFAGTKDPMHFEWMGVDPTAGIDYRSGRAMPLVRADQAPPAAVAPPPASTPPQGWSRQVPEVPMGWSDMSQY